MNNKNFKIKENIIGTGDLTTRYVQRYQYITYLLYITVQQIISVAMFYGKIGWLYPFLRKPLRIRKL